MHEFALVLSLPGPSSLLRDLGRVLATKCCRIQFVTDLLECPDGVKTHLRRKSRSAGRLAMDADNSWSKLIFDQNPNHGFGRGRVRPCTRSADRIESFARGGLQSIATQLDRWEALDEGFVSSWLL